MALSRFRPIRTKEGYAAWLADTAGAHGVYVVRERAPKGKKRGRILYVGESHTHRLRETLQRHYQQWTGRTAGPTFDAAKTEVAIEIFVEGNDAIRRQNQLIRQHKPSHNTVIPDEDQDPPEEPPRKKKRGRTSAYDELMSFFEGVAE